MDPGGMALAEAQHTQRDELDRVLREISTGFHGIPRD